MSRYFWSPEEIASDILRELKAAKQPAGPRDTTPNGLAAWGEMHAIADALKAKEPIALVSKPVSILKTPKFKK